jgi:hypothetical protein
LARSVRSKKIALEILIFHIFERIGHSIGDGHAALVFEGCEVLLKQEPKNSFSVIAGSWISTSIPLASIRFMMPWIDD